MADWSAVRVLVSANGFWSVPRVIIPVPVQFKRRVPGFATKSFFYFWEQKTEKKEEKKKKKKNSEKRRKEKEKKKKKYDYGKVHIGKQG